MNICEMNKKNWYIRWSSNLDHRKEEKKSLSSKNKNKNKNKNKILMHSLKPILQKAYW